MTAAAPSPRAHLDYRPDIDGLRAVAVLAVLGFHASPGRVPGGFVGVDIFFVISGFLISSIVFADLREGRFSLLRFYERRIRRIFPALLLVMGGSLLFGWYALLADEYRQLGRHVAGGAAFVQNLILWSESSYFDNAADTKPLLHLWSLAIEEQFYIFWPLLVATLWKLRRMPPAAAVTLGLASLAVCLHLTSTDRTAAYYAPHARFWELMAGCALAWLAANRSAPSPGGAQALSLTGLIAVLGAAWLIHRDRAFPGAWALLPTTGACLLIAAGPAAWINRHVLASRPMVAVGLISYPLYLWHWPLLSFARIVESEVPRRSLINAALLTSFMLAWMTWRLIERPLRFRWRGRGVPAALLVAMAVLGLCGWGVHVQGGFGSRKAASPQALYEGEVGHSEYYERLAAAFPRCTPERLANSALRWEGHVRCLQSRAAAEVEIALVGDSHAEHLFPGLARELPDRNVAFYIRNSAPFLGNPDFEDIFDHVLRSPSIRKVILSMSWLEKGRQPPPGRTLEEELRATVSALTRAGKEVYLVEGVPTFPFDPRKCRAIRPLASVQSCTMDRAIRDAATARFLPALRAVAREQAGVTLLETSGFFCEGRQCSMTRGHELLYRDDNHLTMAGSRLLAAEMLRSSPLLAR